MVSVYLEDEEGSLPVRRLSNVRVPGMERQESLVRVRCPSLLAGDETAFAFYMHDRSLMPVIKPGTLMYCSRCRDPGPGDMALLSLKDDGFVVRILTDIHEEGLETLQMEMAENWSMKSVREVVSFDDLDEIALVIMTSRYTV